jgi:hypothetical protein
MRPARASVWSSWPAASNDPVRVQVARHPAKKKPPRYRRPCRRSDPFVGRNSPGRAYFSGSLHIFEGVQCSIWNSQQLGSRRVRYVRVAAVGLLVASAIVLPSSEASARCWHNGWGWRCGPGLLALPFVAAGAVVAGAAAIATAPVRAIVGPPYYAPPPAYYPPPGYYAPGYYTPPGYYYGPPTAPR